MVEARQLRYFIEVADLGSITRAADRLGMSQPSLSQQVRNLEQHFGTRLLHRTARGTVPTEAGQRLVERGRVILAQFAELRPVVLGEAERLSGEVRFGMPVTVASLLGVPLIEAARARYPGINIRIIEGLTHHSMEWLSRGEVDLIINASVPGSKKISSHRIVSEELHLFCCHAVRPPGLVSPVSLEQALAMPLVLSTYPNRLRAIVDDAAAKTGISFAPAIEINSHRQIIALVRRGHGFGIQPFTTIRDAVREGTFVSWRIGAPPLSRDMYLSHSVELPLSSCAQAVAQLTWDCVRDLVREEIWSGIWQGSNMSRLRF